MDTPIDLGVRPPSNMPAPTQESPASDEPYFPSCYVTDIDLEDLPEVGTMEVEYRLLRSEKNHKTGKYSYTIELEKILSADGVEDIGDPQEDDELDAMLDEAEKGEMSKESEEDAL